MSFREIEEAFDSLKNDVIINFFVMTNDFFNKVKNETKPYPKPIAKNLLLIPHHYAIFGAEIRISESIPYEFMVSVSYKERRYFLAPLQIKPFFDNPNKYQGVANL